MKTNATVYGYPVHIHREGQWYVIDLPGVGVTQAKTEADIAPMVLDLITAHGGEPMTGTCPHGWTFAHNCPTQPAPELSDYERGVVEWIEAAPAAEESLRERVAIAVHAADCDQGCRRGPDDLHRAFADAAIAVLRGST